jgi:hypothetical protein
VICYRPPEGGSWSLRIRRSTSGAPTLLAMFTEELSWLEGADLEGVVGQGLSAWLGWPEGK